MKSFSALLLAVSSAKLARQQRVPIFSFATGNLVNEIIVQLTNGNLKQQLFFLVFLDGSFGSGTNTASFLSGEWTMCLQSLVKEHIACLTSGLILVQPLDFSTCKWMAVLSSGSSNAALLGVAALTCLLQKSNDNPSVDAMSLLVGLMVDPSKVAEASEAGTID